MLSFNQRLASAGVCVSSINNHISTNSILVFKSIVYWIFTKIRPSLTMQHFISDVHILDQEIQLWQRTGINWGESYLPALHIQILPSCCCSEKVHRRLWWRMRLKCTNTHCWVNTSLYRADFNWKCLSPLENQCNHYAITNTIHNEKSQPNTITFNPFFYFRLFIL